MLIAILTDIHANREALDACVADALAAGAERLVFLGDVVGYGADPSYCTDRVAEWVRRGAVALRGNHDNALACGGRGMNTLASEAIIWTQTQLTATQRSFLATLPLAHTDGDTLLVHAEASAPQRWLYVTCAREAERSLAATDARLTFCGHVHRPQVYGTRNAGLAVEYSVAPGASLHLAPGRRWLTVVGAVGQPRDGDPRACYGLFDTEGHIIVMRRVEYDIRTAAAKILAAELPIPLAERLVRGR